MYKTLYLDIDGVLLTTKHTKAAENAEEFIDFVTKNFDCFWLTTHCKGDTTSTLQYLSSFFNSKIINVLNNVQPTNWETLKTEAINFTRSFIWLDDYPMNSEKIILQKNNCIDSLLEVNLNRENELLNIIQILKNELDNSKY